MYDKYPKQKITPPQKNFCGGLFRRPSKTVQNLKGFPPSPNQQQSDNHYKKNQ